MYKNAAFEITFNREMWRFELRNTQTNRLSSFLEFNGQTSVPMSLAEKAAKKHPALTSRLFRAAVLVSNGAVTLVDEPQGHDGATVAVVNSQSGEEKEYYISQHRHDVYRVGENGGPVLSNKKFYQCTCRDYWNNAPRLRAAGTTTEQPMCKHILAAQMAARMRANAATTPEWATERHYKTQVMNYDDLRAKEDRGEPLTDDEIIFLETEEAKARSERQAAAAARRGPNVYERWRRQAYRDGDGARQYIRTAAANGKKTVPGHIYKRATGEA